jgi:hypothetical protein
MISESSTPLSAPARRAWPDWRSAPAVSVGPWHGAQLAASKRTFYVAGWIRLRTKVVWASIAIV